MTVVGVTRSEWKQRLAEDSGAEVATGPDDAPSLVAEITGGRGPELVVEVTYAHATSGRFRGTTRFSRWRPDREPESCRHDQLVEAEPVPISQVLAG